MACERPARTTIHGPVGPPRARRRLRWGPLLGLLLLLGLMVPQQTASADPDPATSPTPSSLPATSPATSPVPATSPTPPSLPAASSLRAWYFAEGNSGHDFQT